MPNPATVWPAVERISGGEDHVLKFVFTKGDAVAEAVLYRYPAYAERTVICCSVMSGCPVGCRFCGSGDYFVRNLTAEEIVSQVRYCLEETGVASSEIGKLQIMFMSMGEPLLNQGPLATAITALAGAYPNAGLLVSTSAPKVSYDGFHALAAAHDRVGLQFSVHESTDEARDKLVPFKEKLTLAEIAREGETFYERTGRSPFFNYCAHGQNTSAEDVARLRALFDLRIWQATVSVVCERAEGVPKSNDRQRGLAADFAAKLLEEGFDVRVFDPAGQDTIGGGCGQLWFVQQWMRENPSLAKPTCGNGLPITHAPDESDA